MTAAKVAGVLLGFAGVAVIFSNQLASPGRRAVAGSAALVLSAMCAACSNVLVKARGTNLDPTVIAAVQMFFGLIPLLVIGIPLEGNPFHYHWTPLAIICLFYLAIVGSVMAFVLYYWLMQNMDVTKTMLISLVTPVFAVLLGMLVLNEELNWRTFVGGAMIMFGISLIVLRRRREAGAIIDLRADEKQSA
jgi:drug/metabolite transporter (DMT)-like permease